MRKLLVFTFASLLILAMGFSLAASPRRGASIGGCGPGGCPVPPAIDKSVQAQIKYEWKGDENEKALFRNGVQIGAWSYLEGYWRDYDAGRDAWGPVQRNPPVEPPAITRGIAKVTQLMPWADEGVNVDAADSLIDVDPNNHGVDWDKINPHQATFNGRKIGCDRAIELIGKQVPDDSKRLRLTVIGTDAQRQEVLTQFAAIEPEIRDRCNTWAVAADHWSLRDGGAGQVVFKTQGTPVIYLQDPAGKVLHRQDDSKDFPQALRKAIKGYDQAKDPDLRKKEPPRPGEPTAPIHPAIPAFAVLGGLALYFMRR